MRRRGILVNRELSLFEGYDSLSRGSLFMKTGPYLSRLAQTRHMSGSENTVLHTGCVKRSQGIASWGTLGAAGEKRGGRFKQKQQQQLISEKLQVTPPRSIAVGGSLRLDVGDDAKKQ